MPNPDPLAGYRFADRYSVERAAMLIAEVDPADVRGDLNKYDFYTGALEALKNAILWNTLPAALAFRPEIPSSFDDDLPSSGLTVVLSSVADLEKLRGMPTPDLDTPIRLQREPDWERTTIAKKDLKAWLRDKGQFPASLFPVEAPPDFMNPDDPRYSPKLACAVAAWEAVTRAALNKSVRRTIEDWVRKNAERFGLGSPETPVSTTAVKEIAKIVNWDPGGGVPPSGGGQVSETSPPLPPRPAQNYERMPPKPRKS